MERIWGDGLDIVDVDLRSYSCEGNCLDWVFFRRDWAWWWGVTGCSDGMFSPRR